jgi:hypothetical protein
MKKVTRALKRKESNWTKSCEAFGMYREKIVNDADVHSKFGGFGRWIALDRLVS